MKIGPPPFNLVSIGWFVTGIYFVLLGRFRWRQPWQFLMRLENTSQRKMWTGIVDYIGTERLYSWSPFYGWFGLSGAINQIVSLEYKQLSSLVVLPISVILGGIIALAVYRLSAVFQRPSKSL